MSSVSVVNAESIDPSALDDFLRKVYKPSKSEFLRLHGSWWHRGNRNRLLVIKDGEIAGYSGIVPFDCLIEGELKKAIWWVDLVMGHQFRGQGLQRLLDTAVREMADLKFGFPNELAARIHLKHGWGVRSDCYVLLLPLVPSQVRSVRRATGLYGYMQKQTARALTPFANLLRSRYASYEPKNVCRLESASPDLLADIFFRHQNDHSLFGSRDADYIRWRYLESPHSSQYMFYVGGGQQKPTQALVSRQVTNQEGSVTRILDVFGDLDNKAGLREILSSAVKDAVGYGASQITILSSVKPLLWIARSLGFVISRKVNFCWHSESDQIKQQIAAMPVQWAMADSDNDEVD